MIRSTCPSCALAPAALLVAGTLLLSCSDVPPASPALGPDDDVDIGRTADASDAGRGIDIVVPPSDTGGGEDAVDDVAADGAADAVEDPDGEADTADDTVDEPPPEILFETLSITVRTPEDADADGADGEVAVCLTADECFVLETPSGPDLRAGTTNVYQFDGLDLSNRELDRVELRAQRLPDAWRPACVSIALNGSLAYCNASPEVTLGDGAEGAWTDPDGLHLGCGGCYPGPVSHGPRLGLVGPRSVDIWFRTEFSRSVEVVWGQEPDLSDARVVSTVRTQHDADFAESVRIEGLEPNTEYRFRLSIDGDDQDEIVTVRTAPQAATAGVRRFAIGSMLRAKPADVLADLESERVDALFLIGDNYVTDGPTGGAHRYGHRALHTALDEAPAGSRVPTFVMWNETDFVASADAVEGDVRAGLRALLDQYWQNPGNGPGDGSAAFSYRYGDVELFVIDVRYNRTETTLLGEQQTAWLVDALSTSEATFKLILSPEPWQETGPADAWAGYLEERNALFDALIEARVEGLVLVGGGTGYRALRRIIMDSRGGYTVPDFVAAPMAPPMGSCPESRPRLEPERVCRDESPTVMVVTIDSTHDDPNIAVEFVPKDGPPFAIWDFDRSTLAFSE